MKPVSEPNVDTSVLSDLVKQVSKLCEDADSKLTNLTAERESFLVGSLGDALQQLELILRVLDDESADKPEKAERQRFLKRLLGRDDGNGAKTEDFSPPDFDVSRQGFQGNSWTVSLPELVGFLAYGHKTGVLWVDAPEENFLLGLVNGRLVHATSDHTPEGQRLGEVLVGLGYLTRPQLERFLAKNDGNEAAISGEKLLETGMISDEELRNALEHQTRQLFNRLVGQKKAVFRFRESMEVMLAYQVDQDINQLLLESALVQDETVRDHKKAGEELDEWKSWQSELTTGFEVAPPATESKPEPAEQAKTEETKAEATKTDEAEAEAKKALDALTDDEKDKTEPSSEASDPSAKKDDESDDGDSDPFGKRGRKRGRRRRNGR